MRMMGAEASLENYQANILRQVHCRKRTLLNQTKEKGTQIKPCKPKKTQLDGYYVLQDVSIVKWSTSMYFSFMKNS
uniref:Uncharacterized protein n=1 Tax=Rhizophora mucronata TaxID=61149 RepID=A0A2P2Q6Q8_RHIMU